MNNTMMEDVDVPRDVIVSMAYVDHVQAEQSIIRLLKSVLLSAIITQYGHKQIVNVFVHSIISTLLVFVSDAKIIKFLIPKLNRAMISANSASNGIF